MDRILLVDNDADTRTHLATWLTAEGFVLSTSFSGKRTKEILQDKPPDLIIMDLGLPGMENCELCRSLKADEKTQRIPIIVLADSADSDACVAALDAGVEEFVTKPIRRTELLVRIRSMLRTRNLYDRLLLAYYHIDEMGAFAEHYADKINAEWKPESVALQMARQLLGSRLHRQQNPAFVWGGVIIQEMRHGLSFYLSEDRWKSGTTLSRPGEIEAALEPYAKGENQFLSNSHVPVEVRNLVGAPESLELSNFAAVWSASNILFVAGYPRQVDHYEFPILRASVRHWNVFKRIWQETRRTQGAFFYMMEALALAAEFQDRNISGHIRRVNLYSETIARALGCDGAFVHWISQCAQMHDVGKITIPLDLLRKQGPLTDREMSTMKRHTIHGAIILGGSPNLAMAASIARSHHENYDGTGYPDGSRGEDIPLEARIVKIADIYDALRMERPYKSAFSHERAVGVLLNGDERVKPSHLDPKVIQAFLGCQAEIAEIYEDSIRSTPIEQSDAPTLSGVQE